MMRTHFLFVTTPVAVIAALSLVGCASNYAAEGALAGAAGGALIGGVTGGDVGTGAAVGAAAGAVGGTLIKKRGHCYGRDRYGYEYEVRC